MTPSRIAYHVCNIAVCIAILVGLWQFHDRDWTRWLDLAVAIAAVLSAGSSLDALRPDKP